MFSFGGSPCSCHDSNLKTKQESSLSDLYLQFLKVMIEGLGPPPRGLTYCSHGAFGLHMGW